MIWRQLVYLAALLAAIGFYIFHTGYFSWVLLILAVAFLPLEALLSLRCITTVKVGFKVVPRGEGEGRVLKVWAPARFPVCTVQATVLVANQFSGETRWMKIRLPAGGKRDFLLPPDASPCGAVSISILRPRVLDCMGILRFPVKKTPPGVMLFTRPPFPASPPAMPEGALDQGSLPTQTSHRPGPGALREFTDTRPWRDGDSIRDVHWKLSAKLDRVMVREGSYSALASPHLCFDLCGEVDTVCAVLGRLEALSAELLELERLHGIHWVDEGGALQSHLVASAGDYNKMLLELLMTRLPGAAPPMADNLPDVPGPVVLVRPDSLALYEQGALREVV